MSLAKPHFVTEHLHPLEVAFDANFDELNHPKGYVDFISKTGFGTFCSGLTIHTPASRKYWTRTNKEEMLVWRLREGFWVASELELSDLEQCMVIADSDEGDSFVTCPRFGQQIFELPRHSTQIRRIGNHIDDLLVDYAKRCELSYSYFDPWPNCSRRGAIRFVTHPKIGFESLLNSIDDRWQFLDVRSASTYDPDYYQDRFITELHAHIGFYFQDDRPEKYRLPNGSITVTMILDVGSLPAVIEFAESIMIPDDAQLEPNWGGGCAEHKNGSK